MDITINYKNFLRNSKLIKTRIPLLIFIGCFIVYALLTFRKFGITWDEADVYNWGKANIDYYLGKSGTNNFDLLNGLEGFYYNFYASAVILVSYVFKQFNRYEFYHLVNLMFSIPIFIGAYEILLKKYKNALIAILGPIFLLFTPRFFNDIAANPKDVPFAVIYFVTLSLIYLTFKKGLFTKVLVLGVAFGLLQSSRVLGFGIYAIYIVYVLANYFIENKFNKKHFKDYLISNLKELILITIVAFCFMFATWPAVGANSINGLVKAIALPKTFQWTGSTLFNGEMVNIRQIPDAYLPVWFAITSPVFILGLLAVSLIFLKKLIKNRLFILFGVTLVFNFIAYLILNPIIYNGIRHFLFLYPITTLLALLVFIEITKYLKSKNKRKRFLAISVVIAVAINIILVVFSYLRLFPYGYIYFNELVGGLKNASINFETDYWATGTKEAAEWLNDNLPNDRIIGVSSFSSQAQVQYYLKPNLIYWGNVDRKNAQYYIATYAAMQEFTTGEIIQTIERESTPLMYVTKLGE